MKWVTDKLNHIRTHVFWFSLFGLITLSHLASGAEMVDTSEGRVAVSGQSQSVQQSARREALKQVFVKMSGNPSVLENSSVKDAIRQAQVYLRSYRFEDTESGLIYIASFDEQALSALLRDAALPMWGSRRPQTLLWLAVKDDNGARYMLDEAQRGPMVEALYESVQERGVPISLPLMDLQDNQAISIYDVWGRFAESLRSASSRYGVENAIGARLYRNTVSRMPPLPTLQDVEQPADADNETSATANAGPSEQQNSQNNTTLPFTNEEFESLQARADAGEYALDWIFIGNQGPVAGSLFGDDPKTLMVKLVNSYASYLASQFAIVPSMSSQQGTRIDMSVANMDSLEKYAHATAYLTSLSVVEHVTLTKQEGSVATFTLSLIGSGQDLRNTVSLESRLRPVADAFGQPLQGFNYFWNE